MSASTMIALRVLAHVFEGATRRNPGELIEVDDALHAGKLIRNGAAALVNDGDAAAVQAALGRDDARKARASTWRPAA